MYGPTSQIGLIWANVASRASTPKTKKKNAPVLTMKYGYMGWPTTLALVRPGPGIWVCFWCTIRNRCALTRASSRPGISSTWMM